MQRPRGHSPRISHNLAATPARPAPSHPAAPTPSRAAISRREALERALAQAATLAGFGAALSILGSCSTTPTASGGMDDNALPTVDWPEGDGFRGRRYNNPSATARVPAQPAMPSPTLPGGVIPRAEWAKAAPIPARMEPMLPVSRITVHHDGMPPVRIRSRYEAAQRLETIRLAHLGRGFGDIGYHYIIDPGGNVWEGRPLRWQGAHVKAQNPNNLGVMVMGNFEAQRPTSAQIATLQTFVASQMRLYRVPTSRVHTHRELAPTACPGRNLQSVMVTARRKGGALS